MAGAAGGDAHASAGAGAEGQGAKNREIADAFFIGPIPNLEITAAPDEWEKLKRDPRNYAEVTVSDGSRVYKNVALKLKGSAGSFQGVEQKPGMTLHFDKFKGSDRFQGMKKIHLNNCAQDGTYLQEQIAGEIARAAGVPASRCTHALVKLNGRDLGVFVVKEAFTKDFLSYIFKDTGGDLWDGGFCKEIEENMEKDQGDPKDNRAIKQLIEACREGDAEKRWQRVGEVLDIDRYISFTLLEAFLAHWDGYNFNRNNYRVYRDVTSGKISFFLHGMDQTFGDANFPVFRDFPSLVGGAVMKHPQAVKRYRERAMEIYEKVLKARDWPARVTAEGERVRQALAVNSAQSAKDYEGRINEARSRVEARIAGIGRQLGDVPRPPEFDKDNVLKLAGGWRPEGNLGDGGASAEIPINGQPTLEIRAGRGCTASWRRTVSLPPGRYRFEARVQTRGVQSTPDDKGRGAQLRISGGVGQESADADTNEKTLGYEFTAPGGEVVLVAELRAQAGEVTFSAPRLIWQK